MITLLALLYWGLLLAGDFSASNFAREYFRYNHGKISLSFGYKSNFYKIFNSPIQNIKKGK